jgi:hypothetical protein
VYDPGIWKPPQQGWHVIDVGWRFFTQDGVTIGKAFPLLEPVAVHFQHRDKDCAVIALGSCQDFLKKDFSVGLGSQPSPIGLRASFEFPIVQEINQLAHIGVVGQVAHVSFDCVSNSFSVDLMPQKIVLAANRNVGVAVEDL